MKDPRITTRIRVLVAAAAFLAAVAGAQSYGPGEQVLTISAAEFRSEHPSQPFIGSDGYLAGRDAGGFALSPTFNYFQAPLALPEGAGIERICLYAKDSQDGSDVGAILFAAKLAYGGESPHRKSIGPYVSSTSDVGYRRYCQEFSETLQGRLDVDEDGVLDPVAYYVEASLPTSADSHMGFGAVQITWRRQVSPPPSAPTFGDVPDSHTFLPFIEALAASGITGGCGNGNFCPGAPLTRGQMAVFLAKALGLHWP